jgi:UTP:GlnB (protein PII) uridylyltransferase
MDAFREANVLALGAHIGSVEQCHALALLALASGALDDELDRRRVEALRDVLEAVLSRPELTGREATNLVSQRTSEAGRRVDDPSVRERIRAAPRPYVLATSVADIARHAELCEPLPARDEVRVATIGTDGGHRVEFVARDRVGLLAAETAVLAQADLDVKEAIVATWGDGCALASFLVGAGPLPPIDEFQSRTRDALADPPRSPPMPGVVITLDNTASPWHTLCRVTALDRPGLLHQVTSAFAACAVSVHAARAAGQNGRVVDEFELTDRAGDKLDPKDEDRLARVVRDGTERSRRGAFSRLRRRRALEGPAAAVAN